MGIRYGVTRDDGAKKVYFDGVDSGWLMPQISKEVRAASPDIRPAMYTETLYDEGATVLSFTDHYARVRGIK